MAEWLWYFWIYSFLGYLLEKAFAAATRAENQVRRCFLWCPMCPVYGLAMLAVLVLPEIFRRGSWIFFSAGIVTSAVEYAVHWAYEQCLGVRFWDYSCVRGNWNGRICLPFSLAWSVLAVFSLRFLHPLVATAAAGIPTEVTYMALMLFSVDGILSVRLLYRTGNIACLE